VSSRESRVAGHAGRGSKSVTHCHLCRRMSPWCIVRSPRVRVGIPRNRPEDDDLTTSIPAATRLGSSVGPGVGWSIWRGILGAMENRLHHGRHDVAGPVGHRPSLLASNSSSRPRRTSRHRRPTLWAVSVGCSS